VSEGLSRAAVLAALEGFPGRLADAAARAEARQVPAGRPALAGEWGVDEVVRHLIACEIDVHQARLADLDRDPAPVWHWTEPGPWPDEPDLGLQALLDRFAALRTTTLAAVAALDEAGWARSGTHTTLGIFDVRALLANAIDHDEQHLAGLA
jgi:DinB superfamily